MIIDKRGSGWRFSQERLVTHSETKVVAYIGIIWRSIYTAQRENLVRQWAVLLLALDTNQLNKHSSCGQSNVTTKSENISMCNAGQKEKYLNKRVI